MPWCVTRFSRLSRPMSASGAGGTAVTEDTKTDNAVRTMVGATFMVNRECRIRVKSQVKDCQRVERHESTRKEKRQ